MIDWQVLGPYLVAAIIVLLGLPEWARVRRGTNGNGQEGALRYQRDRIREVEGDYDALLSYVWTLLGLFRQHAPDVTVPQPPIRANLQPSTPPQVASRLRRNRARLVRDMALGEIRDAAFDLGLEGGEGYTSKGDLLVALIEYLENRGQGDLLVQWLGQNRSDINLQ